MSMTRKDYELIAEALKGAKPTTPRYGGVGVWAHHGWVACCTELAQALRTTNPAFDKERFLRACGIED